METGRTRKPNTNLGHDIPRPKPPDLLRKRNRLFLSAYQFRQPITNPQADEYAASGA
jgi:hypothetical protein